LFVPLKVTFDQNDQAIEPEISVNTEDETPDKKLLQQQEINQDSIDLSAEIDQTFGEIVSPFQKKHTTVVQSKSSLTPQSFGRYYTIDMA